MEKINSRTEEVCLMNMCMIEDEEGNVVALDKINNSYTGTTFPGGHIEKNEIFNDSIIREVWEETGLTIKNPKLCGVYHWMKNKIHNILFIYKAVEFEGELISSREGRVYWTSLEKLKTQKLATGTEHIITMIENDSINECIMRPENGVYTGTLY